jgi:hypothetical protein
MEDDGDGEEKDDEHGKEGNAHQLELPPLLV